MYPIDPSGNQAHRRLALLLPALFCLSASLACGAVDDDRMFECPEPLLDSGVLKTELADQPLSGALRQQWTEMGVSVSTCPQDGRVDVDWYYRAPADYSAFGLEYKTTVSASFVLATSALENVDLAGLPAEADAAGLAEALRGYIAQAESDARVAEFLGAVTLTEAELNSPRAEYVSEDFGAQMMYAFDQQSVVSYNVPNNREWLAFPEVARAQALVSTVLFTGDLAGCTIRRDGLHASTRRMGIPASLDWEMTVNAECAGIWKDATLRLHPDGSYSDLRISWSAQ